MPKPLHSYGRVLPDWRLDPPDPPDPLAAMDPPPDLQAEAEQRQIDRYLDSLP